MVCNVWKKFNWCPRSFWNLSYTIYTYRAGERSMHIADVLPTPDVTSIPETPRSTQLSSNLKLEQVGYFCFLLDTIMFVSLCHLILFLIVSSWLFNFLLFWITSRNVINLYRILSCVIYSYCVLVHVRMFMFEFGSYMMLHVFQCAQNQ